METTDNEAKIRSELRDIIQEADRLAGRMRELQERLPIPPRDDLMLVGEEEPVFLHVARVVLECALADCLEPLLRDLRAAANHGQSGT
jgi:hypothetical protein